jgi:branched-chain amino acid transport system ATP-binding protein
MSLLTRRHEAERQPWPAAAEGALFALDHVDAAYGPFRALFDITLAIKPGEALAMVGANGAGKTTIARLCSGLIAPTRGHLFFDGADVTGLPAYELAERGISHAPEGRSVFATLSVEENLVLSFRAMLGAGGVNDALAEAYRLFPKLADRRKQQAGSLSGGEQRMLSLARVMVHPPKLLIVDELSLGLAPIIVDEVYRHLGEIKGLGTALLIVEQHVEHALALADQVAVLTRGSTSYYGPVIPVDELAAHLLPGAALGDPIEGAAQP